MASVDEFFTDGPSDEPLVVNDQYPKAVGSHDGKVFKDQSRRGR